MLQMNSKQKAQRLRREFRHEKDGASNCDFSNCCSGWSADCGFLLRYSNENGFYQCREAE